MNTFALTSTINTTGSAGAATGSGTLTPPAAGKLLSVKLDYHASAPATTDVTISGSSLGTILTVANNKTDKTVRPRLLVQDTAGADIAGSYEAVVVPKGEVVTIAIAQADALTGALVATLLFEGGK